MTTRGSGPPDSEATVLANDINLSAEARRLLRAQIHAGPGEWLRLWEGLAEERHEVAKQLERRHQFLERLRERDAELQSLKDSRQRLRIESSLQKLNLERLQKQSEELQARIEDEEHDIVALREGSRAIVAQQLNADASASSAFVKSNNPQKGVLDTNLRALEPELKIVEDIRAHKEIVAADARALQRRQEELLEEQRRAEENRIKLLGDVNEAERSAAMVRSQRVKLSMERQALELELATIAQRHVLGLPVTKMVERTALLRSGLKDVPNSVAVKDEPSLPTVMAGSPPKHRWYAPKPSTIDDERSPPVVGGLREWAGTTDADTSTGRDRQIDGLSAERSNSDKLERHRSVSPAVLARDATTDRETRLDPPSQQINSLTTDQRKSDQSARKRSQSPANRAGDPLDGETRLGPSCRQIDEMTEGRSNPEDVERKRSLSPHWRRFGGHTSTPDCVEWAGRLAHFQAQENLIRSAEENFSV